MAAKVGPNGQQLCLRDRCKKYRDLTVNNLCGGHACPTPNCAESKSSSDQVCENHKNAQTVPLPKGWMMLSVGNGVVAYVDHKTNLTAQYDHPGPKGESARPRSVKSKPVKAKKGYPTLFNVEPQPQLPEGWEQVIAADLTSLDTGAAPQILYRNETERIIQSSDPRPPEDENLPAGWRQLYDPDGDVYFVDDNNDFMTYDDPRLIEKPVEAKSLSQRQRLTAMRRTSSLAKSKKPWTISPCDVPAFETAELYLTSVDQVPVEVRNKILNRYLDILPNPATIVPLEGNGVMETYINANYVRSWDNQPKYYIAAQGPTPSTVGHFWRMIWANRVRAIIMVTGLIEQGKAKCERYFPLDSKTPLVFGDITVRESKPPKEMKGYLVQFLEVMQGGKAQSVLHYWYNTWPDHGVPRTAAGTPYVDDIIGMIKHLQLVVKSITSPILVHCSAGVGRTGTIIAIDHAIRRLDAEGKVDCMQIIDDIRKDRCALVQHTNQYELLHEGCIRYAEMCKKSFVVGDGKPKEEETKVLSAADLEALRAQEKDEAAKRGLEASKMGGRSRLLSSSQIDGVLRLRSVIFRGEKFTFVDVDGDGTMTWKEAQLQGMSRELFDKLDANGDGNVTRQEWTAFMKMQSISEEPKE